MAGSGHAEFCNACQCPDIHSFFMHGLVKNVKSGLPGKASENTNSFSMNQHLLPFFSVSTTENILTEADTSKNLFSGA